MLCVSLDQSVLKSPKFTSNLIVDNDNIYDIWVFLNTANAE